MRFTADSIALYRRELAAELGLALAVGARCLIDLGESETGALLRAGARRRLPVYFDIPLGRWIDAPIVERLDGLEDGLRRRAERQGEAMTVDELVRLFLERTDELAPT